MYLLLNYVSGDRREGAKNQERKQQKKDVTSPGWRKTGTSTLVTVSKLMTVRFCKIVFESRQLKTSNNDFQYSLLNQSNMNNTLMAFFRVHCVKSVLHEAKLRMVERIESQQKPEKKNVSFDPCRQGSRREPSSIQPLTENAAMFGPPGRWKMFENTEERQFLSLKHSFQAPMLSYRKMKLSSFGWKI